MGAADSGAGQNQDVVKWYTHARRFPTLIGRTHDGKRIPGGPYTPTQLIVGAVLAWTASKATSIWAHFGRATNIVLVVVVVGGVTLALGKVPLGTRNPLRVIFGALRAYSVPSAGRYRGSPAKTPQPCRTRVRPAIDMSPPPAQPVAAPVTQSVPAELTPIQDALSRKVPA